MSTLTATANVWVFEPSIALDQRVDDNYLLDPDEALAVSATRIVGNIGLSRESQSAEFRGVLRADGLLSINEDRADDLSSNQLAFLESKILKPRSQYGFILSFKQDTPSRDIASDITELGATAADTGASVTQDNSADRRRIILNPTYTYNVSRRTDMDVDYAYTTVGHGQLSCEDALALDGYGPEFGPRALTADLELDDFEEHAITFRIRHQLSEISRFNISAGYSFFETDQERETQVFEDQTIDPDCNQILRLPRVKTTIGTARVALGYNRSFSRTVNIGGQIGYYIADSDKSNLFPTGVDTNGNPAIKESEGYLASLSIQKDAGLTRYTGRMGVEVYPSDVGDLVESLEVVGDVERKLSPLLDFTFRVRAYEPDTISDESDDDKFARRFLSFEPRLIWRFSRAWTAAASYRYRRQKSQIDIRSTDSNAVLFSLKYTPPSAIADARKK